LLKKCDISPTAKWSELGGKKFNRLCATLTSDTYPINGQSKYKEEFVTCGGVALESISMQTLESNNHPNLYFAGEVLDVDAVTGGFNLQAAWSMGYKVATSITEKNKQKECFS
jgi:predicted flavoprotein YhiN